MLGISNPCLPLFAIASGPLFAVKTPPQATWALGAIPFRHRSLKAFTTAKCLSGRHVVALAVWMKEGATFQPVALEPSLGRPCLKTEAIVPGRVAESPKTCRLRSGTDGRDLFFRHSTVDFSIPSLASIVVFVGRRF